nr:unnamed protein product [Spirometra erinaceieuropaei]
MRRIHLTSSSSSSSSSSSTLRTPAAIQSQNKEGWKRAQGLTSREARRPVPRTTLPTPASRTGGSATETALRRKHRCSSQSSEKARLTPSISNLLGEAS